MELQFHPVTLPGARAYQAVEIRPFGTPDVEAYERVKKNASEPALRNLIGRTLRGVDVNDLYEPDFLFCMMWHRVNSFTAYPMQLPWTCPNCERENKDVLDLTKLLSDEMPEDYDPNGVPIEYPCGIPLVTRLPKAGDEAKARALLTNMSKEINQNNLGKAENLQLFENDTNFSGAEKWDIINRAFTVEDVFTLDAFKRTFGYGPRTVLKCNCPSCGGQQNVGFRFSLLEFLPTDFDRGNIRARILPHASSKDAAKRAKESLFQKAPMVSAPTRENINRIGQEEETSRGQHRTGPTEFHQQEQEHASVPQVMKSPNGHDDLHKAELSRKWGGPPGQPITPDLNARLGQKLLEESRHELAAESDGKVMTAAQALELDK